MKEYKTYKAAERNAKKMGLRLAEYGQIYGTTTFYCCWNKSGDRNDRAAVYCEYKYDTDGRAI